MLIIPASVGSVADEVQSNSELIRRSPDAIGSVTHASPATVSLIFPPCPSLPETPEEMLAVHRRLKLSAFERDLGLFIVTHREAAPAPHPRPLRPYQQLLADYRAAKRIGRLFIVELLHYRGQHQLAAEFEAWELPRFPVNGATLKVMTCTDSGLRVRAVA